MSTMTSSSRRSIVSDYIDAAEKNITLTDIVSAASITHLEEVNRLYVADSPQASKVIHSIDDVTLKDGDLVLIKDQADPVQNGIYTYTEQQILQRIKFVQTDNCAYVVENGTVNGSTTWISKYPDYDDDNIVYTFVPAETYDDDAEPSRPRQLQQSVKIDNDEHLTVFDTNVGITGDLYIRGTKTSLLSVENRGGRAYDIFAVDSVINLGAVASGEPLTSTLTLGTDNSVSIAGPVQTRSDLNVGGNLFIHGTLSLQQSLQTNRLFLVDQDSVPVASYPNAGQLILCGADSSKGGPHITTFTGSDTSPLLNICSMTHDDISINMDCFYDGNVCHPSANTSCRIRKNSGQLQFAFHDKLGGIYRPALSLDLDDGTALFTSQETIFAGTNGANGSIKIAPDEGASESSIAFYSHPNLRNSLASDFWKISLDNITNVLGIYMNTGIPALTIDSMQTVRIHRDLTVSGSAAFDGVTVSGSCDIASRTSTAEVYVTSLLDASAEGTAAAVVNGGMQIGKSIMVNDRVAAASVLVSSDSPKLVFNALRMGEPMLNETSSGTRILLQRTLSPATTNSAIGVANATLWYAVPGTMEKYSHTWYAGSTSIMSLDGVGNLAVNGSGNSVRFSGLSARGMFLGGTDADSPCSINFSDNWRLGQNDSGNFVLQNTVDRSKVSNVLSFDRSANVLTAESLVVERRLNANRVSSTDIVLGNPSDFRMTNKGMTWSGKSFFAFPNGTTINTLSIHSFDDSAMSINCNSTMTSAPRTSITDVNRNNLGETRIWCGAKRMLSVSHDGVEIEGFVRQRGELNVNGNIVATSGEISADRLQVSTSISLGGRSNNMLTFVNDTFSAEIGTSRIGGSFYLRGDAKLEMSSRGGMYFSSEESVEVSAPLFQVGGNFALIGSFSQSSHRIGNLTTREGNLCMQSLDTALNNDGDDDTWHYVGRLNTTPNGRATDECGSISIKLENGTKRTTAATVATTTATTTTPSYGYGTTTFRAYVKQGQCFATHETKDVNDDSSSHVYVFRNDDADDPNFGDFHVYILSKNKSVTKVAVTNYISAISPIRLSDEGSGNVPSGSTSGFNDGKWTQAYTTRSSPSARMDLGSLFCDKFESRGSATFLSNVRVVGTVAVDALSVTNDEGPLSVKKNDGSLLASFGTDATVFTSTVVPNGHHISLGDPERGTFDAVHVDKVNARAVSTRSVTSTTFDAQIGVFSDFVKMNSMQVTQNGTITGNLLVKGSTNLMDVSCRSVDASERLTVSGHTVLGNTRIESDFVVTNGFDISGKIRSIDFSPFTVETDVFLIQSKDRAETISLNVAEGSISSSTTEMSFLPGNLKVARMTSEGIVEILPDGLQNSSFVVNTEKASFASKTTFKKNVHFDADVSLGIDGGIRVGELWKENSVMNWSDGLLQLCVPGSYAGTADATDAATATPKLSIDGSGHVTIHQGLTCRGNAILENCLTDSLIADRIVCREKMDTSYLLLYDEDGSNPISSSMYVDEMGFHLSVSDPTATVANSARFSLGPSGTFHLNGRAVRMTGDVTCPDGIHVGKGSTGSSGLVIHTDDDGNNGMIKFLNDTENVARLQYHSSKDARSAKTLSLVNDGGSMVLHAAGKRGIALQEITGNATFDGMAFFTSAVDIDSSGGSIAVVAEPVASLNTKGGAVIGGHLFVKRSVVIANVAGTGTVSFSASDSISAHPYGLTLPPSLPQSGGSLLSCDLNGNLSWVTGSMGNMGKLGVTDSRKMERRMESYSALGDTRGDHVIVPGLTFMGGPWDELNVTVVEVTKTETRYGTHVLRAIFRSDAGWRIVDTKTYGDDISVRFSVDHFSGNVKYRATPVEDWVSTTMTWTLTSGRDAAIGNTMSNTTSIATSNTTSKDVVFGSDGTTETGSPLLTVRDATVHVTRSLSNSEWSGTLLKAPTLKVSDDTGHNSYSVSTLTIEDAPSTCRTEERYALMVKKGKVVFSGEDDDLVHSTGGLIVDKTALCSQVLAMDSMQIGPKGTSLKCVLTGKIWIGQSADQKLSQNVIFSNAMENTDYHIFGNVVSAMKDGGVFVCNFKQLRNDGCTVEVFRIDGSSWSDTSLSVHYVVTSLKS